MLYMNHLLAQNISKLLARLLLTGFLLGVVISASGETVFVVGSYQDEQRAQRAMATLSTRVSANILVHRAEVQGVTRHRLVITNDEYNEVVAGQIDQLGIAPWRMNLSPGANTPDARVEEGWQLAGTFSNISDALEMERRLVHTGRLVKGRTEFVANQLVHQVWIRAEGQAEVNPANRERESSASQSKPEAPRTKSKATRSYPENFNLARLPPRRDSEGKPR